MHHYLAACERADLVREQETAAEDRMLSLDRKARAIKAGLRALRDVAQHVGWQNDRRFAAALDRVEATAGEWLRLRVAPRPTHVRRLLDNPNELRAYVKACLPLATDAEIAETAEAWRTANQRTEPAKRRRGQPAKARTPDGRVLTIAEAFAPVRRGEWTTRREIAERADAWWRARGQHAETAKAEARSTPTPLELADYIIECLASMPASAREAILPDSRSTEAPRYRLAKRLKLPAER